MPIHELIIYCSLYHLQQSSATPQRAPEVRSSVQCIGILFPPITKQPNLTAGRLHRAHFLQGFKLSLLLLRNILLYENFLFVKTDILS